METVIGAMGLGLGLILLWTGRQRFEVNSFQTTMLSVLEFAGFVVSVIALGWLGVWILLGVNVVAVLVWSGILAAKKQSILIDAAVQSSDMSAEEAGEIWDWMAKQKAFAVMRPLERGELIRALAEQARSPSEIRPKVADTIVTATKNSAATFEDMLTAMIVAGGGSADEDTTAQAA